MLTLKGLGNVDDGGSWQKLKSEVEAQTVNESETLSKLTEIVLHGFINRLARETTGKKKMVIVEKTGTKRSPESAVERENDDYVIRKQKKQKTGDNGKHRKKKKKTKKQKTSNNREKKHNQKKGQDPIVKFTALGLEPPPDMPEEFKNCIQNFGGTEIKLVLQKFIQVTDLNEQQNRLSMPLKQVRNEFSNEAEEEKLDRREAIEVVFVEPCLKVSKLNLNKWQIGATWSYVLNGSWHRNIVKNNGDTLKPMAVVQAWSFRVGPKSQLGFALIKVGDGEDGHVIH